MTINSFVAEITFNNKKFQQIATELLIRRRKPNIYLVFITQSYFTVTKNVRLNSAFLFIIPSNKSFNNSI